MPLLILGLLCEFALAAEDSPIAKIFPAWQTAYRETSNRAAAVFLCIFLLAILVLYKLFVARERKVANPQKAAGAAQKNDGSAVTFNGDPDAPLLAVGNQIMLAPTSGSRLAARVVSVGEFEIVAMVLSDQLSELTAGRRLVVKIQINNNCYAIKAALARVDSRNPRICTLIAPQPVTLNHLRQLAAISKPLPALIGVIPNRLILKEMIPFADIYQKAMAEIPATLVALDTDFATLRTASPLDFTPGDLLLLQLTMPTDHFYVDPAAAPPPHNADNELTIWCNVSAVYKLPPDVATMMRVDFLTADPRIAHLCATVGRPFITASV